VKFLNFSEKKFIKFTITTCDTSCGHVVWVLWLVMCSM